MEIQVSVSVCTVGFILKTYMFTMIALYLIIIFASNLRIANMAVRKYIKIQMVLQSGTLHARYCVKAFFL